MLLEKIVIIFVAIIYIIRFSNEYITKSSKINLFVIALISFTLGVYIPFAVYDMYMSLKYQIILFLIAVIVPTVIELLQYNNIILFKNIRYYYVNLLIKNEEYDKVIKKLKKMIKNGNKNIENFYLLGICYKNKKMTDKAKEMFYKCIDLDSNFYKANYELGLIFEENSEFEMAENMYIETLNKEPKCYEACETLGINYTSQGKYKEALELYKEAMDRFPNAYELYYNTAIIELQLQNFNEAKKYLKKAIKIKPDLYIAYYNIGNIYFNQNDFDEAIEAYKQIEYTSTYEVKASYRIALAYAAKCEYDLAMPYLKKAIELEPSYIDNINDEKLFSQMKDLIDIYLEKEKAINILSLDSKNDNSENNDIYNSSTGKLKKSKKIFNNSFDNKLLDFKSNYYEEDE